MSTKRGRIPSLMGIMIPARKNIYRRLFSRNLYLLKAKAAKEDSTRTNTVEMSVTMILFTKYMLKRALPQTVAKFSNLQTVGSPNGSAKISRVDLNAEIIIRTKG
jgi:hypothetical protein